MASLFQVFQSRKMAALLFLGFSSGLPLLLSGSTVKAWLTVSGVPLAAIGFMSLVGIPYSFKFLWSPLIDRFVPPFLGRRRGWILLWQICLMLAFIAMSLQDPQNGLKTIAIIAVLIAFFSASQDIAYDAFKTDSLSSRELGAGAAVSVFGYRVAMLVSGSFALIMADHLSWPIVYLIMAGLMGLNILTTFLAPEPERAPRPPDNMREAFINPFMEFFTRSSVIKAVSILAFITLYKLGDALIGSMATPFLIKIGFTQTEVGALQGGVGLGATMVGVFAGGALMSRLGINRSLWIFGFLQAVSNLMYYLLSLTGPNAGLLAGTVMVENFCGGLGTAAFVAFIMRNCNARYSATQYALLTSLMAVSRDVLVSPSGKMAEMLGWPTFFLVTIAFALPGIALLPMFAPWRAKISEEERTFKLAEGEA